MRAALAQLQQMVIDRDIDAFFDEVSLRMQHYEASRWGTAADAKQELADTIFSQQIDVRPLDVDEIELEPRREGRVVVTRRPDGRPVIEASAPNTEGAGTRKLGVNPIFAQHEGRWRVIL